MVKNGTHKFTQDHMNYLLVETWGAFKISYTIITQEDFNNIHLLTLSLPDKVTNHQA